MKQFNLGDSLLLHIQLHNSIQKLGNVKSYDNQIHKQILGSSVLSIDENTLKKPRKKDKTQPIQSSDNSESKQGNEAEQYIHYDVNATNLSVVRNLFKNSTGHAGLSEMVKVKNEFNKGNTSLLILVSLIYQ